MTNERPWLAEYPEGVPAQIDVDEFPSVVSVLEKAIDAFRDRPAFANLGKVLSYGDVDRLSKQFAAYLLGELGLKKGDRVAIMMPNCLQYPIAIFGILRAGLTVVNVNPMYTARELKHQLVDSGASVLVVLDNFGHTVQEVIARHTGQAGRHHRPGRHARLPEGIDRQLRAAAREEDGAGLRHPRRGPLPRRTRARPAQAPLPDVEIAADDIAFLQYTGGTTGVSKGAMLTHRNLVANMQQASAWIGTNVKYGEEIIITALPLYHIFALTANCLVFMKFGGLNYLITNPRDMPGFVKELKKIPFTAITGVNTLFNGLLNTPGFDQIDFSNLHLTLGGGMAVQRAVAERWKQVTGVTLVEAYGLTETSPAACINPMDLKDYNGAIGLPIPSTDACVKDEDGRTLPTGEVGELCIQGPQVMKGYWQRPEETAKVIDADGWLHTGDMAKMDETRLLLHRRPQEGHDPGVGLQRVPERGRGRDRDDAGRARGGGGRRAGRQVRRGGQGGDREEGPGADRRTGQGALPART